MGRPVVVARRSTERPEVLGTFATLVDPATGIAPGRRRARGRRRRRPPPARRARRRRSATATPRRASPTEIAAAVPRGRRRRPVGTMPPVVDAMPRSRVAEPPARPVSTRPLVTEAARCCICGTRDSEPVGVGPDFEYRTSPDSFLAVRCTHCGVVYLDRRPVAAELDRIYPDHYHAFAFTEDRFGFVYSVRRRLEARRLLHAFAGLPADARDRRRRVRRRLPPRPARRATARRAGASRASTSTTAPSRAARRRGITVHRGRVEDARPARRRRSTARC